MTTEATGYTVGEVSALAGVTVRTLHHYDEIGLLKPSGRSGSGYRHYDQSDLHRLQQILLYRELGFRLEDIAAILDDPSVELTQHLRRQHDLLTKRIARMQSMLVALEKEMEAEHMGIQLTPEERFEVWGDFDPDDHAEEAEERWGITDAFKESQRRTGAYTKDDWQALKDEADDINRRFVGAMTSGEAPDGERAASLAEEHRRHISRWFYECGHDIHKSLGDMYVTDHRFKAHYEAKAEGLATYVRTAIHANAERSLPT